MGLDMYLSRRTYVKNWEHHKPEHRHEVTVKKGGKVRPDIKPERVAEIVEEIAYWRKANAIHAWFVRHVQSGEDDCKAYYVSRDDLRKLKADCDKVLAIVKTRKDKVKAGKVSKGGGPWEQLYAEGEQVIDTQIAETILPTQEGSFFGGTDYDSGYLEDLTYTSNVIGKVLAEEPEGSSGYDCGEYEYRASW